MMERANAVLIGGQKGGTGKSTTAVNLAVMSKMMGHDTVLVDTDKDQFTASKFLQHRQELKLEPTPDCVQLTGKIKNDIENLAKRYKRVIIDAGGRDSVELRYAMTATCVGLMMSPFKPTDFDMKTLENVDDLVGLAQGINTNLKAYIYFSQCNTHFRDTALDEAREISKTFSSLLVCPIAIFHRVAYQTHTSTALSLVEYETSHLANQPAYRIRPPKASLEMSALYEFVFNEKFKHDFINKFETVNKLEVIENVA